jgi:NADH-ubiquinone oxidoreductase chain 5
MLVLIIFFPLVGFLGGILFGKFMGRGVCIITTGSVLFSFILSFYILFDILTSGVIYKLELGSWIVVDTLNINWFFYFDSLTAVMLVIVTLISTLVHLYSTEYMEKDPHLVRFMSYLSLFTFFMLILVTGGNFLQMFVGWEGVGLSSFLLINFWFTRIQANKAAIKAMIVNRVGDFFILISLFSIYFCFHSLDYDVVFNLVNTNLGHFVCVGNFQIKVLDIICCCLFLGAMGKSAQIGLHTWLPDAMEGPTPVSALIHAATMVTAGVFLLSRCSFIFEYSSFSLIFVMVIGACTSFFAATTGAFQNDIKKVIAYSTCSQLGYMIFACGLSSYDVGVFHLSNHAFFKALLFLGAGSIIHAVSDEQDMRRLGGLRTLLPFSYSVMLVGSLALIGFPFLSGFYSKDVILEIAFSKNSTAGHFCYYLGSFAAFFTAFYSTRLLFLVFLSNPNGSKKIILGAHEGSWGLGFPLLLLSFLSIIIGFLTKEFFIGFGTSFWNNAIFILPANYSLVDIEYIDLFAKIFPLLLTLWGVFFGFMLYCFNIEQYYQIKNYKIFKIVYSFLNKKWYFDRLYNQFIGQIVLNKSYSFAYTDIDRGLLELFGPSGISHSINAGSKKFLMAEPTTLPSVLFFLFLSFNLLISVTLFIYYF